MEVKIKDAKKLKELAKKYHQTPAALVNAFIEALPAAHRSFDEVAKKTSFRRALGMALWNSEIAYGILQTIEQQLGKHDYESIEDFGFDPQERSFWFLIDISENEKVVDIDQIHVEVNPGSAILSVMRWVEGIYATDEEWDEIRAALPEYDLPYDLDDSHSDEGGEILGKKYPDSITIDLTFRELEDFSEMPTLVEANEQLNEVERSIRQILKKRKPRP